MFLEPQESSPGHPGLPLHSALPMAPLELFASDGHQLRVDKRTPLKLLKVPKINQSINIFVPNCSSRCCRCSLALEIPLALFSLYIFNGKLGLKSSVSVPAAGTLSEVRQRFGLWPSAGAGLSVTAVALSIGTFHQESWLCFLPSLAITRDCRELELPEPDLVPAWGGGIITPSIYPRWSPAPNICQKGVILQLLPFHWPQPHLIRRGPSHREMLLLSFSLLSFFFLASRPGETAAQLGSFTYPEPRSS